MTLRAGVPILLVALASCGRTTPSPSAPGGAASPAPDEAHARFIRIMEGNDIALSALQSEATKNAGRERCLGRLNAIRTSIPEAVSLRVRTSDREQEELKREFSAFLQLLDELERESWQEAGATASYRRLEQGCNHCHIKFK